MSSERPYTKKETDQSTCFSEGVNLSCTFILKGVLVLVLFQKENDGIDQNRPTCKVKLQFAVAAGTVLLVAFEQWIFRQHWS